MKQMVTFATIISFLTAPVLAWLSYKLVTKHPQIKLWSTTETRVAKMGIVALVALSILYVVSFL
jgi:amino acid permease